MTIVTLLNSIAPYVSASTLKQLRALVSAMLSMSGQVTTLGLGRWAGKGGSVRSLQRLYHTQIGWGQVLWALVKGHGVTGQGVYLLAADEVVVSKTGKHTSGVGRFYSSTQGRTISAVSFMVLSVLDVEQHRSFPVQMEQRLPAPKGTRQTTAKPAARPRGRPPGGQPKAAPVLSQELHMLDRLLDAGVTRVRTALPVQHLVLDGFFGNYPASRLVRQHDLQLISKLCYDAALYLPYVGANPKRGPRPKYGHKLDYTALPAQSLLSSVQENRQQVDTYQLSLLHKDFATPLNVVLIVRTQLKTGRSAHVILFSTDPSLSATQLVEFYSLRFQIEFNFRDAKQFWGLDDFMNTDPLAVTNAVYLSFFMVNLSAILLAHFRISQPSFSLIDLKAHFRALRYRDETIALLPVPPSHDLVSRITLRLTALGRIHSPPHSVRAA